MVTYRLLSFDENKIPIFKIKLKTKTKEKTDHVKGTINAVRHANILARKHGCKVVIERKEV